MSTTLASQQRDSWLHITAIGFGSTFLSWVITAANPSAAFSFTELAILGMSYLGFGALALFGAWNLWLWVRIAKTANMVRLSRFQEDLIYRRVLGEVDMRGPVRVSEDQAQSIEQTMISVFGYLPHIDHQDEGK